MSERIAQDETLTVRPPTDAEIRRAALTVCDRATDTDDARVLLEALGLLTYDGFDARGRTNSANAKFPRVRVGALDRKKEKEGMSDLDAHRTRRTHVRRPINPAHVRDALQALLNTGHPLPDVHRASCEALGRAVGLDFAGLYAAAHEGRRGR